jgi:ribosomal peptide maturation radical SAM protein 1
MSNKLQDLASTAIERNSFPIDDSVEVLLISMPFGPLLQPSIGLSLLKASLIANKITSTKILYFTIKFAELIDIPLYLSISNGQPSTVDLVGEWIFNGSLFNIPEIEVENYIRDVLREFSPKHKKGHVDSDPALLEEFIKNVLSIRNKVELFLDQCLEEVLIYKPKIVALTSIFQQQVASLSLAKRIKEKSPDTFIILGGANCEGIMGVEVVRQFDFINAVISGEGDIVFPKLVQRVLDEKLFSDLEGVYTRENIEHLERIGGNPSNACSVVDMDALPFPDYDDFFEQLNKSKLNLGEKHHPRLLFETSRGCWWGEKHHCVFCGLNGSTIAYRSKSASRAFQELIYLTSKYPECAVSVVDNILDMEYFKSFVPELSKWKLNLELFYEVKANLKKEQIHLLHEAGITSIQPGIESLSTGVLKIMRKGVKGLQNIQLLKWCKELGVKPYWNVLWGFPGENPEEYTHASSLVKSLVHLQPPGSSSSIRLDRFSPYFDKPNDFGFIDIKPYPSYSYIYPIDSKAVANLAYFFTFDYKKLQDVEIYTRPLSEKIEFWQKAYEESDLFFIEREKYLLIWDLRKGSRNHLVVLEGLQKNLYIACDSISSTGKLKIVAECYFNKQISDSEIETSLDSLVNSGLMVKEDNNYLSLAIPLANYSPKKAILEKLQAIIESFENKDEDKVIIDLNTDNILIAMN